jgi:cell division protein FtsL
MRNTRKKKISLFNVLIVLFTLAGIIVFFVYNIIKVNSLAVENNNIYTELNKAITLNNGLQTEVERLSTFENIKSTAVDKLKLALSSSKMKKISVSRSELDKLKQ